MFKTLEEYLTLARRMIYRRCKSFYRDDEAISYVAYHAMLADQNYKDGVGTRDGYRVWCADMGCLKWLRKIRTKKHKKLGVELTDSLNISNRLSTQDMVDYKEIISIAKESELLTDKEKNIFNSYYVQNNSAVDIAKQMDISKARVYQILNNCISKLKIKCGGMNA